MKAPQRRWKLSVEIGADSEEAAIRSLQEILFSAQREGAIGSTSGGYDAGWIWNLTDENPEITHELFAEQNEAYCQWLRDGRTE